jgi:TIR domain-containing protein
MVGDRIRPLLEFARGAELERREEIERRKMAHDVFICHSAKDKTTADAVCAMLESSGIRCWIAPRDVTAGMEWSECIIDAIEECRVMVLVFTTNANESSQIRREIERAVNRGVAILPLRIEDILPGRALEYFIGNVHWLDAMTPPLESHLNNLAGTVKILLGRLPLHAAPIPHPGVIPQAEIPQAETVTPKVEWGVPVRPREVEKSAAEILRETPARRIEPPQIISTPTPPPEPIRQPTVETRASAVATAAKVADTGKLKRPIGVMVVAALNLIFAGLMALSLSTSGEYERDKYGVWFVLLAISAAAASYGLFKLKQWGQILGIVLPCAGIVWLISAIPDAFREATGVLAWLGLLVLFGGIVWYLVMRATRVAFGGTARGAANIGAVASATTAERNSSSELFAKGMGRRPRAVLAIAILSFVEAGIWVIPITQALSHNRTAPEDFGALLLVCAAAAIGFGLIRLMRWARLLKVVVALVDAVLMIHVAQDAFREGGSGELSWIGIFIYVIWSALYLFTPQVRRAFQKVA